METSLTVLIPTYNRKDALLQTLGQLYKQREYDFRIVISDNASEYSVTKALDVFTENFRERIVVARRKYNIGATSNIVGLFSLCETRWGWLLGDDDIVTGNAIQNILEAIEDDKGCAGFWFSVCGKEIENCVIQSLEEYIELCERNSHQGDVIYLSNKVYNMDYISECLEMTHRHSYTCIGQCIPMFELLKKGRRFHIIYDRVVVKHPGFDNGITWNIFKTVMGMRTLMDYQSELPYKMHIRFVKAIMFSPRFVVQQYIKEEKLPWNYKLYLNEVYYGCFSRFYKFPKRMIVWMGIKLLSSRWGFYIAHRLYLVAKKQKAGR